MGLKLHGRRLARSSGYKKALQRNLVTDLLKYEKVTTTEAKAKEVRILTEKMITLGKKGNVAARRQALAVVFDDAVTAKLFNELATRYADRKGGYTRITKLGPRLGDSAPIVKLELVK